MKNILYKIFKPLIKKDEEETFINYRNYIFINLYFKKNKSRLIDGCIKKIEKNKSGNPLNLVLIIEYFLLTKKETESVERLKKFLLRKNISFNCYFIGLDLNYIKGFKNKNLNIGRKLTINKNIRAVYFSDYKASMELVKKDIKSFKSKSKFTLISCPKIETDEIIETLPSSFLKIKRTKLKSEGVAYKFIDKSIFLKKDPRLVLADIINMLMRQKDTKTFSNKKPFLFILLFLFILYLASADFLSERFFEKENCSVSMAILLPQSVVKNNLVDKYLINTLAKHKTTEKVYARYADKLNKIKLCYLTQKSFLIKEDGGWVDVSRSTERLTRELQNIAAQFLFLGAQENKAPGKVDLFVARDLNYLQVSNKLFLTSEILGYFYDVSRQPDGYKIAVLVYEDSDLGREGGLIKDVYVLEMENNMIEMDDGFARNKENIIKELNASRDLFIKSISGATIMNPDRSEFGKSTVEFLKSKTGTNFNAVVLVEKKSIENVKITNSGQYRLFKKIIELFDTGKMTIYVNNFNAGRTISDVGWMGNTDNFFDKDFVNSVRIESNIKNFFTMKLSVDRRGNLLIKNYVFEPNGNPTGEAVESPYILITDEKNAQFSDALFENGQSVKPEIYILGNDKVSVYKFEAGKPSGVNIKVFEQTPNFENYYLKIINSGGNSLVETSNVFDLGGKTMHVFRYGVLTKMEENVYNTELFNEVKFVFSQELVLESAAQ
jgi:hypothetical protein